MPPTSTIPCAIQPPPPLLQGPNVAAAMSPYGSSPLGQPSCSRDYEALSVLLGLGTLIQGLWSPFDADIWRDTVNALHPSVCILGH